MKQSEAKKGMQVTVIGDTPDPQVYYITEIKGNSARIAYTTAEGKTALGGLVDLSMLVEAKKQAA
jgi:hypothetical protein